MKGLNVPKIITIEIFEKSNKALFIALQDRLIVPYSLALTKESPINEESIHLAKIVSAHEYGHAIFKANSGDLIPPTDIRKPKYNLLRGAMDELFADVIAIYYAQDLTAVAKAQLFLNPKATNLRTFDPHDKSEALVGTNTTDALNPIRRILGKKMDLKKQGHIHHLIKIFAEETLSLKLEDAEKISYQQLSERLQKRLESIEF